jgi:hypothetical protein
VSSILPVESTVVPQWKVRVVDESGKAVAGVGIREVWGDLSIELSQHVEERISDDRGNLVFPARTLRANLVQRVIRKTINSLNVHGSEGPTAYLLVLAPYKPAASEPYYQPGRALESVIVVRL